jgi:surface antigen
VTEIEMADSTLMALADGELPEADARRLRGWIAADPILAARFALFVETRALVRQTVRVSHDASGAEKAGRPSDGSGRHARLAVGAEVRAAATSNAIVPRPERKALWQLPLAASLVFTVGGLAGYLVTSKDTGQELSMTRAILSVPAAESALTQALDSLPSGRELRWSGQTSGLSGRVVVLSTHRLNDATYCREYEISFEGRIKGAVVGASCRRNGVWHMEIAAAKPDQNSGYAPASGTTAVEQYLVSLGSSGPMSVEDERSGLARGW